MSKLKFNWFFLAILYLCILVDSTQAGSFYSSRGIGLRRYFVSGRSVGMGGVGLSISDNYTINYMNPATLADMTLTSISGNFLHEATDLQNPSQDAFISETNVFGLKFVIPLKSNSIAIALGLNQYTNIEYTFSERDTIGEKSFREIVSGDGGINTAVLSLAVKPFKQLYLGVSGLYYFGKLRNKWKVIFDTVNFRNTQDEVAQIITAVNIRFGMLLKIFPAWSIGAVFTPSVKLDADKAVILERIAEYTDFPDSKIEIPTSFGVGTSIKIKQKLTIGADFYSQKWSESKTTGFVNDSKRIALGIEFLANNSLRGSYFSRVAYRAGFYYNDLGLEEPTGEKVSEIFASIGIGLPVKWSAAKIDLSLEGGKRGVLSINPFREKIIRLTASVTVGEKWFYRVKR